MPRKKRGSSLTSHPSSLRLAEGEATGHYHEAAGIGVSLLSRPGDEDLAFAAPEGATVTHQEHHAVELPAGNYVWSIVQEYDHFAEESRRVVD